jgi:hypothetical protein
MLRAVTALCLSVNLTTGARALAACVAALVDRIDAPSDLVRP